MRTGLRQHEGQRQTYTAKFQRYGKKASFRGPPVLTLLMHDVRDARGEIVTGHIWFTMCKAWADVRPGDWVQFTASVKRYEKGYRGRNEFDDGEPAVVVDYKLAFPADVKVIDGPQAEPDEVAGQLALFPA